MIADKKHPEYARAVGERWARRFAPCLDSRLVGLRAEEMFWALGAAPDRLAYFVTFYPWRLRCAVHGALRVVAIDSAFGRRTIVSRNHS